MKKSAIIIIFLIIAQIVGFSQENRHEPSNADKNMLPGFGDIGIGINAEPIINIFADDQPLNFTDNTLYLRYFLTDDAAIRLYLGLRMNETSKTFYVRDDEAFIYDPLSNKQVKDRRTQFDNFYTADAGYQYFIGDNRIRGFLGIGAGYHYFKNYYLYEYGNIMNDMNDAPTQVVNWDTGETGNLTERTLKNFEDAATHGVSAGLFTGAEYYILPKFCIGLEIGFAYAVSFPGQEYTEYETMVGTEHVEMTEVEALGDRWQNIGTSVPYYGKFYLFFHF